MWEQPHSHWEQGWSPGQFESDSPSFFFPAWEGGTAHEHRMSVGRILPYMFWDLRKCCGRDSAQCA